MKTSFQTLIFLISVFCSSFVTAESTTLIRIKGSDTMVNVAQSWAEAYEIMHPSHNVAVSVGGGGSGTGFHAMLIGTSDLVNASRKIDLSELERAQRLGMEPVAFIVGYDALAVYLHKDNPLDSISFKQLEEIYGRNGGIKKWSDL